MSSDTDLQIQKLLAQLEGKRRQQDDLKKKGGWSSWLKVILIGLGIFIGVGVVHWLLNRHNKELARLKTKEEQENVRLQNALHAAAQDKRRNIREALFRKVEDDRRAQLVRDAQLKVAVAEAEERAKKLKQVQSWKELNDA